MSDILARAAEGEVSVKQLIKELIITRQQRDALENQVRELRHEVIIDVGQQSEQWYCLVCCARADARFELKHAPGCCAE